MAFLDGTVETAVTLIPDRLYWAPLKSIPPPDAGPDEHGREFWCTDGEFVYEPFFADFGPLNLGMTVSFCRSLHARLTALDGTGRRLYHACSFSDGQSQANAAVLAGAYMVLVQGSRPDDAYRSFFASLVPPIPSFRDASMSICHFKLTALDCLRALGRARDCGMLDVQRFGVSEYHHFEKVENGDLTWIEPGRIIAFAGPVDNPAWTAAAEAATQAQAELGAAMEAHELAGAGATPGTTSSEEAAGDKAVVEAEHGQHQQEGLLPAHLIALHERAEETGLAAEAAAGAMGFALTPAHYIPYFQSRGVGTVVRCNTPRYDRRGFTRDEVNVHEIYFPDGSVPPMAAVRAFVGAYERCCQTPLAGGGAASGAGAAVLAGGGGAGQALAVHCKAGLGRTGTLIAAAIMKRHGFTAREAIAWCRICRPGSVLGPQQSFLIHVEAVLKANGGAGFGGPAGGDSGLGCGTESAAAAAAAAAAEDDDDNGDGNAVAEESLAAAAVANADCSIEVSQILAVAGDSRPSGGGAQGLPKQVQVQSQMRILQQAERINQEQQQLQQARVAPGGGHQVNKSVLRRALKTNNNNNNSNPHNSAVSAVGGAAGVKRTQATMGRRGAPAAAASSAASAASAANLPPNLPAAAKHGRRSGASSNANVPPPQQQLQLQPSVSVKHGQQAAVVRKPSAGKKQAQARQQQQPPPPPPPPLQQQQLQQQRRPQAGKRRLGQNQARRAAAPARAVPAAPPTASDALPFKERAGVPSSPEASTETAAAALAARGGVSLQPGDGVQIRSLLSEYQLGDSLDDIGVMLYRGNSGGAGAGSHGYALARSRGNSVDFDDGAACPPPPLPPPDPPAPPASAPFIKRTGSVRSFDTNPSSVQQSGGQLNLHARGGEENRDPALVTPTIGMAGIGIRQLVKKGLKSGGGGAKSGVAGGLRAESAARRRVLEQQQQQQRPPRKLSDASSCLTNSSNEVVGLNSSFRRLSTDCAGENISHHHHHHNGPEKPSASAALATNVIGAQPRRSARHRGHVPDESVAAAAAAAQQRQLLIDHPKQAHSFAAAAANVDVLF